MERNFGFVNGFDEFFVFETFDNVNRNHEFAVVLHEFFDNVHTFTEELAFAFATLFSRAGDEALEPRRRRTGIFNSFNLCCACFECGLVQVLVNSFFLFGALAVNRSVHGAIAARATVKRLVTKAARTAVAIKASTTEIGRAHV